MIELLSGKVVRLATDSLTLMVGGVGFRAAITPRFSLKLKLDQELELVTRLVVREETYHCSVLRMKLSRRLSICFVLSVALAQS